MTTTTWTLDALIQVLGLLKEDGALPNDIEITVAIIRRRVSGTGFFYYYDQFTHFDHLAILACVEGVLKSKDMCSDGRGNGARWFQYGSTEPVSDCESPFTAAHIAYCRLHGVEAAT